MRACVCISVFSTNPMRLHLPLCLCLCLGVSISLSVCSPICQSVHPFAVRPVLTLVTDPYTDVNISSFLWCMSVRVTVCDRARVCPRHFVCLVGDRQRWLVPVQASQCVTCPSTNDSDCPSRRMHRSLAKSVLLCLFVLLWSFAVSVSLCRSLLLDKIKILLPYFSCASITPEPSYRVVYYS